jgi:hypothetical protein
VERSVRRIANEWLDREVESSARLCLLHGRLEPMELGPPRKIVVFFRHYLQVQVPGHRRALTQLLLGDHPLGVEQLRRAGRYHPSVPRPDRLCRLCREDVETPEHILLICNVLPALSLLRHNFCLNLQTHGLQLPCVTCANATCVLQGLVYSRSSIDLLAKYVYDALAIVGETPLYRP